MKVWIVGISLYDHKTSWACEGVYDSEEKAIKACKTEDFFIAEIPFNTSLAGNNITNKALYPLLYSKKEYKDAVEWWNKMEREND